MNVYEVDVYTVNSETGEQGDVMLVEILAYNQDGADKFCRKVCKDLEGKMDDHVYAHFKCIGTVDFEEGE